MSRRLAHVLGCLALCGGLARDARGTDTPRPVWNATTTRALMIGVLEWEKPGLAPFPKAGRVDRVLERTLVERGVPADHVTFLEDRAARLSACRASLAASIDAVEPGAMLIVYYAGHGVRSKGRTWFMPYDADAAAPATTGWEVDEIGATLARRARGKRVLLLADCCHSGALEAAVRAIGEGGGEAACLTSSGATCSSTSRWTFSETLVSIFGRGGAADTDDDDTVTFDEADGLIHREMRYREEQWTKGVRTPGFPATLSLSTVDPARRRPARVAGPWQVGDFGQIDWRQAWWPGRVLEVNGEKLKVHYVGYGDRSDQWIDRTRFRAYPPLPYAPGAQVNVEWKGSWYPAQVLRIDVEFARVRFDGYGEAYDEWVTAARVRPRS